MAITAVRATTLVLLFQPLWAFSAPATAAEAVTEKTIETIIVTGRRDSQPLEKLIGAIGRVTTSELELVSHQHIHQAAPAFPVSG